MGEMKILGDRLQIARERKGLSFLDLAEKTGLPLNSIFLLEQDGGELTGRQALKLATALATTIAFLIGAPETRARIPLEAVVDAHGGEVPVTGMFICIRGPKRRTAKCEVCGGPNGSKLCDGPGDRPGKTCDVAICARCATHVRGKDLDYCPEHRLIALGKGLPGDAEAPPGDPPSPPRDLSAAQGEVLAYDASSGFLDGDEVLVTTRCANGCGFLANPVWAQDQRAIPDAVQESARRAGMVRGPCPGGSGWICAGCASGIKSEGRNHSG